MARRATLDESSSSDDEDTDEVIDKKSSDNDCGEAEKDDDDCVSVSENTDAAAGSQYSLHEFDDQVEFIVQEDIGAFDPDETEHIQQDNSVQDPIIHEDSVVQGNRRYRFRKRRLLEVLDENETYEEEFKEVFRMSRVTFREVSWRVLFLFFYFL